MILNIHKPWCIRVIVTKFYANPLKRLKDIFIFTKRCQIIYFSYMHIQRLGLRHEWLLFAGKQINEMSPKKDRILMKVLGVENGYGAKKIITQFPRRTTQLLPLISCCVRLIGSADHDVNHLKERLKNANTLTLWRVYHWQSSVQVTTVTAQLYPWEWRSFSTPNLNFLFD